MDVHIYTHIYVCFKVLFFLGIFMTFYWFPVFSYSYRTGLILLKGYKTEENWVSCCYLMCSFLIFSVVSFSGLNFICCLKSLLLKVYSQPPCHWTLQFYTGRLTSGQINQSCKWRMKECKYRYGWNTQDLMCLSLSAGLPLWGVQVKPIFNQHGISRGVNQALGVEICA